MANILLGLGITFTIGHVLCDLWRFREHVTHARDWFSAISAALLIGHVVLTGELARWVNAL